MDEYRLYRTVAAENLEVVYYALELIRNADTQVLSETYWIRNFSGNQKPGLSQAFLPVNQV